jgi:hypothetical protein
MVTRRDYTAEGIEAARSVLIELVHLLGEYKGRKRVVRAEFRRARAIPPVI